MLTTRLTLRGTRQDPKLPALVQAIPSREAADLQRQEAQRRRHQAVADEANCVAYEYRAPLEPGLAFFELLARTATGTTTSGVEVGSPLERELRSFPVRVSPTLIRTHSREKRSVVLLFTRTERDGDGAASHVLHAREFATEQQFRKQRQGLLHIFTGDRDPLELDGPFAVSKRGTESCKSNETFLLASLDDVEVALDSLWDNQGDIGIGGDGLCAIQKLVVSKSGASVVGSNVRKAWIARPVYRKKDSASWVWILTDSNSSELTESSHDACQIVRCAGTQSWVEPRALAAACSQRFETVLHVSFQELVLDLIQDSNGEWWLLQVKAFRVRCLPPNRPLSANVEDRAATRVQEDEREKRVTSAPDRLNGASAGGAAAGKKWRCAGKFCRSDSGIGSIDSSWTPAYVVDASTTPPSAYWTKKVLLSCEFFDAYMTQRDMSLTSGFGDVSAALAFHLQHQLSKRERNQLYEPQPLCSVCASKYHGIREQWLQAVDGGTKQRRGKVRKPSSLSSTASTAATPPRLLPALRGSSSLSLVRANDSVDSAVQPSTMQASHSAPSVLPRAHQPGLSPEERARPAYLSELDRIDELLASATRDKTQSMAADSASSVGSTRVTRDTTGASDSDSSRTTSSSERLLQQRRADAAESVEEMWKRVSLKPLAPPMPGSLAASADRDRPPQSAYNTRSRVTELEKQQQAAERRWRVVTALSTAEGNSDNDRSSLPHRLTDAHTITIQDCQAVFFDEAYRESVVAQATAQLLLNAHVRIKVVRAPTGQATGAGSDSLRRHSVLSREGINGDEQCEMAAMALRTLFLDLGQSAPDPMAATMFRGRPTIVRTASGCTALELRQPERIE